MILINFRLALRNLFRDSLYSFINIGGLAIGISAAILLLFWVQDELSFDRFHPKGERIYRAHANFNNNGNSVTWTYTPGPIAVFGKQQVPAIEDAVRIRPYEGTHNISYGDKTFQESGESGRLAYTDPSFFKVFNFPLTKGNASKPFPDNKSIILSESFARKLFGPDDPKGKVVQIDQKEVFTVSGVMTDPPSNSTLAFHVLLPFDILIQQYKGNDYWKTLESDWGNYYFNTYFLLTGVEHAEDVAKGLSAIHHKNQKESSVHYSLQPLTQLHLYNADLSEGAIQTVRIFIIIAVAILMIACINYINLATARATRRAKEVGVRKTVGANRGKLIVQFLIESAVVSALALLVAIVLIQLAIPFYNALSGKVFVLTFSNPMVVSFVAGTLLITWLTAGVYPAFVLSSFQPMQAIRGKLSLGGNSTFRKVLVVAQFTISIVIMIGTFIVGNQLDFIRNRNLGFSKDNTFIFELRGEMFQKREFIRSELLRQPGVEGVSFSGDNILTLGSTTGDSDWEGKSPDQGMMIHPMAIDENFIPLMKMELISGQGFTGTKADSTHYIVNETAVREMGLNDPVGKRFTLWQTKGTIIGVTKDFHHQSMRNRIEPAIFYYNPGNTSLVYVRTNGARSQSAVKAAEKLWKQYNAAYPFDFNFLDASYDKMYKTEQQMASLFVAFSSIAIIISCLGLFGLATFTAVQRVKEIGIRKVMGANVNQIVVLLSKDFLKLVLMAMIVAIPVSFYAANRWLEGYAYHITPHVSTFIVAGLLSLLVALLTISFQTIRAALGNPVNSLRSE